MCNLGARFSACQQNFHELYDYHPIVCIADALGVLFSVAFFYYKTRSFKDSLTLAVRYRCLTEDDPAEPRLERTWWFRFSVFALGALPQAVKVLAMGGIALTKTWGMAYLVSFLVLEGLDLLQPRQHRDDDTLETDVTVLNECMRIPGFFAVAVLFCCFVLQLYLVFSKPYVECKSSSIRLLPEPGSVINGLSVSLFCHISLTSVLALQL